MNALRRIFALLLLAASAHARLPEPDAVIHGFITIDGIRVTAARSDVVVEARRIANGPVLATYRMGSDPAVGDRFVLRIPLESLTPPVPPLAAAIGETVNIQVRSALTVVAGQVQTLAERGQIRRLDFTVGAGGDNGLPDAWETRYFGAAGQDPNADPDGDGLTTRQEFEAGTHPVQPEDVLALAVDAAQGAPRVSFVARAAGGIGYAPGTTRVYSLEASSSADGPWGVLPGYDSVFGADQVVTHLPSSDGGPGFYRLRVVLRQP